MEPGPGFQLPLLARTISSRRFAPEREDSESNLSAARRRRPLGTLIIATRSGGNPVNYPLLKPVGFLLHRPNLLILLRWISRGSASTRACSRPALRMFLAAFTSLSTTSPHLGQSWTLSDSSFGTASPHPEHFCDVPLGLTSIARPPRLSAL